MLIIVVQSLFHRRLEAKFFSQSWGKHSPSNLSAKLQTSGLHVHPSSPAHRQQEICMASGRQSKIFAVYSFVVAGLLCISREEQPAGQFVSTGLFYSRLKYQVVIVVLLVRVDCTDHQRVTRTLLSMTWFAVRDRQPALSPTAMLSLLDMLNEVPLLLDLLPSKSLAALVAVSRAHRRQVHNHVTQTAIPDHEHIQTLFRGVWPRLQSWQIGDRLRTRPAGTHMRISYAGAALHTKLLTLCEDSNTAADVVAQLHCVSGSTLQSCRIKSRLSCAGVHAFCTHTWPALQQLDLDYYQLDAMAISHLAAASWPCLTKLGLSGTGLTHAALQQLCLGCWPALTNLNNSGNQLSSGSISLLSSPPLSGDKVGQV